MTERAHAEAVGVVHDVARFGAEDVDAQVAASFACPYCLRAETDVDVTHDNGAGSCAACRCRRCDAGWSVLMDAGQLLRLTQLAVRGRRPCLPMEVRFGGDWM